MKKKSNVYDRREFTYLEAHENLPDQSSFDEIIDYFKKLKQKYLEHEFLYKRKVLFRPNWFSEGTITIQVVGPETDEIYNKRIEQYEKRLAAQKTSTEKRKQIELNKRIKEFKKMKEFLAKEIDISKI